MNYRSRDGRTLSNDDNDRWLEPAFAEAFRVLRPNRVRVSFYDWSRADRFLAAWRAAGFRPVGHLGFVKPYTSAMRFGAFCNCSHWVATGSRFQTTFGGLGQFPNLFHQQLPRHADQVLHSFLSRSVPT